MEVLNLRGIRYEELSEKLESQVDGDKTNATCWKVEKLKICLKMREISLTRLARSMNDTKQLVEKDSVVLCRCS